MVVQLQVAILEMEEEMVEEAPITVEVMLLLALVQEVILVMEEMLKEVEVTQDLVEVEVQEVLVERVYQILQDFVVFIIADTVEELVVAEE